MGSMSNTFSSSARHVTTLEFSKSLIRVLGLGKSSHSHNGRQTGEIGLAISGGVDSMALAALCSNIQDPALMKLEIQSDELKSLRNVRFRAFIVDHQVRTGSHEEAKAVSNVLERRGITAEVLKIDWPESQSPAKAPNFESLARKYRYRLLGLACRDRKINSLLLAHHEDDQVETIVMRLIGGHRRGLAAMKEVAGMPECDGIHGVYESGGPDISPFAQTKRSGLPEGTPTRREQLKIESGGIRIYRLMLGFSKARLIATCQHENMEWFEDYTNKDPTITKRNAIRHMYNCYTLPAALAKPALLRLSRRKTELFSRENALVDSLVAKCIIKDFNTRTGTVTVRFPDRSEIYATSEGLGVDALIIAARFLLRIMLLITPEAYIFMDSLHHAVSIIFPNPQHSEETLHLPKAFTVSGVHLQPFRISMSTSQQPDDAHTRKATEQGQKDRLEWLLSRQPYHTKAAKKLVIIIPPTSDASWTPWTLYDDRFWMRVQNLSDNPMEVRPFSQSDMLPFRRSLHDSDRRRFQKVLKNEASGHIRWTLPAITKCEPDGEEIVLALPTLGFHVPSSESVVRWEVRYKKVNLTSLSIDSHPVEK